MATPFASPATSGDTVKPADLVGHLLIITPLEYKASITTSFGDTDAISVDLIDLTTNEEYSDVLFFNAALKSSLKPNIGKKVLAKMNTGIAKPGKSAPYILDAVTDEVSIALATARLASGIAAPVVQETPTAPAALDPNSPEILALIQKLGAQKIS